MFRQFGKPRNSRKKNLFSKSTLLIPTVPTNVFNLTTLFLFFSSPYYDSQLHRILEYCILYKGLFARCRWITVAKKVSYVTTSSLLLQPPTPAMNFVMFWPTSYFFFLRGLISLSHRSFIFVLNCQKNRCCSRRYHFNLPCLLSKSRFIHLLNNAVIKLQLIGMWVRKQILTLAFCGGWERGEGSWNLPPSIWGDKQNIYLRGGSRKSSVVQQKK